MPTDHRAEAERLLASTDLSLAAAFEKDLPVADQQHAAALTGILTNRALTHATLARSEEHAAQAADMRDALTLLRRRDYETREALSAHIAEALTSDNIDRWKAGRDLAKALDGVDANLDNLIDARLEDNGRDPKSAWNGPAATRPVDDPWPADPQIEKDAAFRQTVTEQIIRALLDPNEIRGSEWARRLAWALKDEGIDLTDAIQARITDLTLGRNPSDPPF